jgi:uncharacterized alpha-E superfamily protein
MKCLRCGEQIVKDGKLLNDAHTLKYDICKCKVKKMYEYLQMVATHPRSFANCRKKAEELLKEINDNLEERQGNARTQKQEINSNG